MWRCSLAVVGPPGAVVRGRSRHSTCPRGGFRAPAVGSFLSAQTTGAWAGTASGGATTVDANTREAILQASTELLSQMVLANDVQPEDVASVFFTTTRDLNADFPALAARQMGWNDVALLCGHEMDVPGSLAMCLRILLHVNTETRREEIAHVSLRGARVLRPDKSAF